MCFLPLFVILTVIRQVCQRLNISPPIIGFMVHKDQVALRKSFRKSLVLQFCTLLGRTVGGKMYFHYKFNMLLSVFLLYVLFRSIQFRNSREPICTLRKTKHSIQKKSLSFRTSKKVEQSFKMVSASKDRYTYYLSNIHTIEKK